MTRARCAERGLSLVELLVGITIALLMVAAGATLLTSQLRESSTMVLEARLMQELRTTTDLVSRDLRRAGFWGAAADGVWHPGATGMVSNPYVAMAPATAASDAVRFFYSRDATENHKVDANEQFGFRLRKGVIEIQLGAGNWQALTDAGTLQVTQFELAPTVQSVSLADFCPNPCPPGATTCPPVQQVRSVAVSMTARLVAEPAVLRTTRSEVRLRNDLVVGGCAT